MSPERWGVEATEFNSSDPSTVATCSLSALSCALWKPLRKVSTWRCKASTCTDQIVGFFNDAMLLGLRHVSSQVPGKRCDKNLEMLKYVETGGNKFRWATEKFNYKLGWATLVERPWYRWCHWAAGSWCWFKPHKLGDGALAPKKHGEIDIQGWKLFHSDCIMSINFFNGPALAGVGPKTGKDGQSVEFVENWRCQVRM